MNSQLPQGLGGGGGVSGDRSVGARKTQKYKAQLRPLPNYFPSAAKADPVWCKMQGEVLLG